MDPTPDFIIIGAMKAGTTWLHRRLAAQPGVFMATPKEPNFFSDEPVWGRGLPWYHDLFRPAPPGAVRGEASTHYTKRPTHPLAAERLAEHCPGVRLIYIVREPVGRLVSQYVHEWSQRLTASPIDRAVGELPFMADYSRYAYQLEPYLRLFGPERILPVFFERMTAEPTEQLERVARFIGLAGPIAPPDPGRRENTSSERLRLGPRLKAAIDHPVLAAARRRLVPKAVRERIKGRLRLQARPELSPETAARLRAGFDADLRELGRLLGIGLAIETYPELATADHTAADPRFVGWGDRASESAEGAAEGSTPESGLGSAVAPGSAAAASGPNAAPAGIPAMHPGADPGAVGVPT